MQDHFNEGVMTPTTLALAPNPDLALTLEAVSVVQGRLWSKVDRRGPDDCWPWLAGCCTDGYGIIWVVGRSQSSHRAIFLLVNGWLPPVVMHSCDNPPCCNPSHLIAGTKALNNADKMAKGRFRPCFGDSNGSRLHPDSVSRGDGHYARQRPELLPRGERHGMAKITAGDVSEMRRLFALGGRTKKSIAEDYGISQSHIGRILNRTCWK